MSGTIRSGFYTGRRVAVWNEDNNAVIVTGRIIDIGAITATVEPVDEPGCSYPVLARRLQALPEQED